MSLIENFIIASNKAATQDEVFDHFKAALAKLGFDRVVYSLLTDHASLNRKAGHGVMCNYPADWMEHYTKRGYQPHDPVIHHAFTTREPYCWKELAASGKLTQKSKRILDEAREARLHNGAAVAIYGPNFEIAVIGLASSAGGAEPDRNTLAIARALAHQFHSAYSTLDSHMIRKEAGYYHLTRREAEILQWSAEGKSVGTIADILGISDNAVKFHLKNIYRKLDVTDRMQAVVKALMFGLINPSHVRRLAGS